MENEITVTVELNTQFSGIRFNFKIMLDIYA